MITGIVLAAGASRRMGSPKALLEVNGETFYERAVAILKAGGCDEVVVVADPADPEVAERIDGMGVRSVPGAGRGSQQIDSLRAGLRALDRDVMAAVVLPVDHPLVAPETVAALIGEFRASAAPIVLPVTGGERGHPALFGAPLFEELLGGTLPEGARSVVHEHADEVVEVEVEDRGILLDIDTPADYSQHLGRTS